MLRKSILAAILLETTKADMRITEDEWQRNDTIS
jgi:hypothetical protein